MEIIFSNQLEMLYERLKERLFANASPFAERIVSLSCSMMRSWLSRRFADDGDVGISMGIKYSFHRQVIADFSQFAFHLPSTIELSLAIETQIKHLLKEGDSGLSALFEKNRESIKLERKIAHLSHEIAFLFQQYGIDGAHIIAHWNESKECGWQGKIWKKLFEEQNSFWTYPLKVIEKKRNIATTRPLELHLFGLSTISPLYHHFLRHLSQEIPIVYYLLSPSQNFWSDLVTDKQIGKIVKKGSLKEQEQLEELLRDRNPLLANMGKLGRKFLQEIEQDEFLTQEHYVLSEEIASQPHYQDILVLDNIHQQTGKGTLLEHVHGDLLLLRTPEDKIDLEIDHSLTIHSAPSLQREVEILYDNILRRMHEDGLAPEQMLVMAPDINLYTAAINTVFGTDDSAIEVQFYDLETLAQSRLAKGFYLLLDLADSRWDSLSFLQLLEHPDFQQGQKIKTEDLLQIREWIEKTSIAWGLDVSQRQEILKRQHMPEEWEMPSEVGTWKQGLDNLLDALVLSDNADISIEFSQAPLLGRWIQWLNQLRKDFQKLQINKTLNAWILFLRELFENYFPQQNFEGECAEQHASIFKIIGQLYSKENAEAEYSWLSIRTSLDKLFLRQEGTTTAKNMNAVQFCSLRPMRGVPAEAMFILGMDDLSFPRRKKNSHHNMFSHLSKGPSPSTPADEDRYLFLEAIISARSFLTISYTWDSDNKEKVPSIIVGEFIDYLNSAYTMQGKKIAEAIYFHHPYRPYALEYYNEDSPLRSYSLQNYKIAKASLSDKQRPGGLHFSIFPESHVEVDEDREVDIKWLSSSFGNPIKTFLKKKHSVVLSREDENLLNVDEPFLLNSLDLYFWKKELMAVPTEEVVSKAYREGKFPPGLFGKHAYAILESHREQQMIYLQQIGIDSQNIFSITFCDHQSIHDGVAVSPICVHVDNVKLSITGKIEGVSPQGLLLDASLDVQSVMKHWPTICLFYAACQKMPIQVAPNVHFLRDQKTVNLEEMNISVEEDILSIVRYSLLTEDHLFLYLPEWIQAWRGDHPEKLNQTMEKSLHDPNTLFFNREAQWLWRDKTPPTLSPEQHQKGQHFIETYFRFFRLLEGVNYK